MNRVRFQNWQVAALAAALALDAAGGARAQSQAAPDPGGNPSTFRLPTPTLAPPRAAGPADDGGAAPVPVAPKTAAPTSSAAPVITLPAPKPTTAPSAPAVTRSVPAQTAPSRQPPQSREVPRAAAAPRPGPTASSIVAPAPGAMTPPTPSASVAAVPAAPTTKLPPAPVAPASKGSISPWWFAALAAVLALAGGGFVAWRRRSAPRALPASDFVPPLVPVEPAAAPPEKIVVPIPAFVSIPAVDQAPEPPAAEPPRTALALALEATRMSATLFNATLAYRLLVTNTGSATLSGLEIGGDMISAHASRATEEQLGTDGAPLAPLHGIAGLAPGESVTLGGELRLPLSAILPIRRGDAQLFVPLARFSAQAHDPAGRLVGMRRAFLVGQSRSASAGKLQPFRLDLGPRLYSELGQRALG